jgi:hypothetical protein
MKHLIFLIFNLVTILNLSGQENTVYTFVDKESLNAHTSGVSFKYTRQKVSDSIYKEKGLFTQDSADIRVFKKSKGKLYVKIGKNWMPFFDGSNKIRTVWKQDKYSYNVKWEKTSIKDGDCSIYKLRFIPNGFSSSSNPSYFFSYNDGVVAIDGDEAFLVRTDKQQISFGK